MNVVDLALAFWNKLFTPVTADRFGGVNEFIEALYLINVTNGRVVFASLPAAKVFGEIGFVGLPPFAFGGNHFGCVLLVVRLPLLDCQFTIPLVSFAARCLLLFSMGSVIGF